MNIRAWLNDVVDLSKAPVEGVKRPCQQHDRLSDLCSSRRSHRADTEKVDSPLAASKDLTEEGPTLQDLEPGFTFPRSPSVRLDNAEECFQRRPRRKTREDRYDPHARKRKRREHRAQRKQAHKRARVDDNARSNHRQVPILHSKQTGNKLIADFEAVNVPSDRLTLRRSAAFTMFDRGKASAPVAANGLPNLALSETRFLGGSPHANNPRSITIDSNANAPNKQDRHLVAGEREVESYFNSLLAEDEHCASVPCSMSHKRRDQDRDLGRLGDNRVPSLWSQHESALKSPVPRVGQTSSKHDQQAVSKSDKPSQLEVSTAKHRSPSTRSPETVGLGNDLSGNLAEGIESLIPGDRQRTKLATSSPMEKALRRCASATLDEPARHNLSKTAVQSIFGGPEKPLVHAEWEDVIPDTPQKRAQYMYPPGLELSQSSMSNAHQRFVECLDGEPARRELHSKKAIIHSGTPRSNHTGHKSASNAHGRRVYNEECHRTSIGHTPGRDVGYGWREETTLDLSLEQGARALGTTLPQAHKAPEGVWRIGRKLY